MGNLCPPVLGTQKGDASYQTQRFPFEVWEEVRRPERGQLDAQDFHILHILGGNSRNCATGIHNPYWVTVPPSQGPRGAGGEIRGAGVPAHRPRLPKAQVQLSLMALCLLPDASLCSFLKISSILAFPEPGHPTRRACGGRA